ncbi:MAG: response regulator [Bacteroidales bacterium]|jgi:CheY-like chemotaxis protein/signal transduction histidine kinase|nr:response regulator [Bacteroidales bacterium]
MYKNIIKSLEIGKNKNITWFERSRDVFMSMLLLSAGILCLLFGSFFLFQGEDIIAYMLYGYSIITLTMFFYSKKIGYYKPLFFNIFLFLYAVLILAFLFLGQFAYGLIHCTFFTLITVSFLDIKKGTVVAACFIPVFLLCGILTNPDAGSISLIISDCILSATVLVGIGVLQIINKNAITESDNKISDVQKDAQEKSEYISQLSHQIRTPLNNIVIIGNLLNDTSLTNRQKDWMETILASANTLENVVNMIASKVTSTEIVDTKSANVAFNLQSLLKNTVQLFVGQSDDYNIALKPNMDEPLYDFEGNPIQIKQIFLTLIDAIIKNKKSEKINIIISYKIKQDTERSFNVSFEIRTSDHFDIKHEDNANMLSYSISSHLVEMMGGKLSESHDENYTIFGFSLPFKIVQSAVKERKPSPIQSEQEDKKRNVTSFIPDSGNSGSNVELKDADILLVEDNLINQKIVILSIQKLVKNIDVANNGQEALDMYSQKKYDIVLMDIQMPIMDGIQATKKIREIESETQATPIPIIAITANALAGDREHCLASGMNEYISKPFQVEVLVNKMKNLLATEYSVSN